MAKIVSKVNKTNKVTEVDEKELADDGVLEKSLNLKSVKKGLPVATVKEEDSEDYLTKEEASALSKGLEDPNSVSTRKMRKAVEVVQDQFHLQGLNYSVSSFQDGETKSKLSLSNEDFDIVITIKNNDKFQII